MRVKLVSSIGKVIDPDELLYIPPNIESDALVTLALRFLS